MARFRFGRPRGRKAVLWRPTLRTLGRTSSLYDVRRESGHSRRERGIGAIRASQVMFEPQPLNLRVSSIAEVRNQEDSDVE